MCGVERLVLPWMLRSPQPWSSARMTTIFGGRREGFCADHATAAPAPKVLRKLLRFIPHPLSRTDHGQIAAIRAGKFVQDCQSAMLGQHPAKRLDGISIVEAQAHALTALQRDFPVDHGQA